MLAQIDYALQIDESRFRPRKSAAYKMSSSDTPSPIVDIYCLQLETFSIILKTNG